MNFEDFKWMCILSNNDYNTSSKNVFEYYKLYKKYKYQQITNKSFIDYVKSEEFMTKTQIDHLNFVYNMYKTDTDCFNENKIVCNKNDNHTLHKLLEQDNFIYPPQLEVC